MGFSKCETHFELSVSAFSPLFSHDPPTSSKRLHVKEAIMISMHPYPHPVAFIRPWYIQTTPPRLFHICNNRQPDRVDLHTWHLLSERSPLPNTRALTSAQRKRSGSTAYLFRPMFGKMRCWLYFSQWCNGQCYFWIALFGVDINILLFALPLWFSYWTLCDILFITTLYFFCLIALKMIWIMFVFIRKWKCV